MRRFGFEIRCFQAKFKNAIPAIESHLTKKKPRNFAKYLSFIIAILKTFEGVAAD
jgi:hypothetical protein